MTAVSEPTSPSKNLVGPVIQAGEIADAVAAAVREDNAGKEVTVIDRGSYVRIEVDTECVIRRETLEAELGRPFRMAELEVNMPSFVGQIETASDHIRFYNGTRVAAKDGHDERHRPKPRRRSAPSRRGATSPASGAGRASTRSCPPTCCGTPGRATSCGRWAAPRAS